MITENRVKEIKSVITLNTSTSYTECDRMFISDFLFLDEMISKHAAQKHDAIDSILKNLK